jgi:hypothetical protein
LRAISNRTDLQQNMIKQPEKAPTSLDSKAPSPFFKLMSCYKAKTAQPSPALPLLQMQLAAAAADAETATGADRVQKQLWCIVRLRLFGF